MVEKPFYLIEINLIFIKLNIETKISNLEN